MNIYNPIVNRNTKYVGLFCNARDEKNIKEWAAHHLLIGFDIIIIFDHKSVIPLKVVFQHFDKRVTIIKTDLPDGNIKIPLMVRASKIAKKLQLDWFIYLDADEFIILNGKLTNVKQLLNVYSRMDSFALNWLCFGSNHFVNDPSGLILENYTKSSKLLDKHVKTFVRPNVVSRCINPHYYNILNPYKMTAIQGTILKPPYYFNNIKLHFKYAPAYIAHYMYQSEETYLHRKINKMSDDGRQRKNIGEEIHKQHNEVQNEQPQKYVKRIQEFLKYYER